MMSAKFSDFSTPLVRKFTQPPLLRLLTMSAFEGSPSPLSADVINGSPRREEEGGEGRSGKKAGSVCRSVGGPARKPTPSPPAAAAKLTKVFPFGECELRREGK